MASSAISLILYSLWESVLHAAEPEPENLFSQQCRSEGFSSRKNGEHVEQCVSRRRRSWTPLTQMDPVIHLSERHRSDMLLDLSGLTQEWRVEGQASINNESVFDNVADALVVQHPRVHLRERRKRPEEEGKDTHRLREGGKHSGNGKSGTSACFVEDYDHGDDTVERADTMGAKMITDRRFLFRPPIPVKTTGILRKTPEFRENAKMMPK